MQLFLKNFFTFLLLTFSMIAHVSASSALENDLIDYIKKYLNSEEIELNFAQEEKKYVAFANNVEIIKVDIDEKYRKFTAYLNDNNKNIMINGRYEDKVLIPILKTNLRKGEVITLSNIENRYFAKHKLHPETIFIESELVGKTTPKFLLNNKPILSRDIQEPFLIRKNDLVTVKYQTKNLNLSLTGTALSDGVKGEVIKVKNVNSNNIITAIVADYKTAFVQVNH